MEREINDEILWFVYRSGADETQSGRRSNVVRYVQYRAGG